MTDSIRAKATWMAERGYEWKSERVFRNDADGDALFMAYHPNLDCPMGYGETHKEALDNLDKTRVDWFEQLLGAGKPVPLPSGYYFWRIAI